MYIHIYAHTQGRACVCVCVYVYVYICIYIYTHMRTRVHVQTHARAHGRARSLPHVFLTVMSDYSAFGRARGEASLPNACGGSEHSQYTSRATRLLTKM